MKNEIVYLVLNPGAESEIQLEVIDFQKLPVAKMRGPAFSLRFQRKANCANGCSIQILSVEKEYKDLDYETRPFSMYQLMNDGNEVCLY